MKFVEIENRKQYKKWFEACEDACIISALSGKNGDLYVDDFENPTILFAVVSDYVFLAGAKETKSLNSTIAFIDSLYDRDYNIRCVEKSYEPRVMEILGNRHFVYSRFATEHTFKYMDFDALKENVKEVEKTFSLALINEELFEYCKKNDWAEDFVISYENYEKWEKGGLGIMILKEGDPVAGASSYSSYPGGIEIEIITRPDYRKQGLALAAGSKLILECKERDLIASWDAAHEASLRLAQRLGYKLLYKYEIIGVRHK